MNFKPELLTKVLQGTKTQTRRIVKDNQFYADDICDTVVIRSEKGDRVKWRIGQTYAAAPGRGKCGQGRIKLTKIRLQRCNEITDADAQAEGFKDRYEFLQAWDCINGPGYRSAMVWVLNFEVVDSLI